MEAPESKVHLKLTMGQDKDLNLLAHAYFNLVTGQNNCNNLKNQVNLGHELGSNMMLRFSFGCQLGREKQCQQYIEAGIQANTNGPQLQHPSPLQSLFSKPKNQQKGSVTLYNSPGFVVVQYVFYEDAIANDLDQLPPFQNLDINFNIQSILKGFVKHNKQNRIAVKIDYSMFELNSEKIMPNQIIQLIKNTLNEDDFNVVCDNPLMKMLGKLKKVDLNVHTNSYRKIFNFFQKASKNGIEHQTKQFPYVAPGILKNNAECLLFVQNKYAAKFNVNYFSEEVFLRLIKVYTKFIESL